jgi:hypothetical protein
MIARLWHGRVPAAKAARYRAFLAAHAVSDYRSVDREYLLEFEPAVVHYEVVGGGPSVDPGTGT